MPSILIFALYCFWMHSIYAKEFSKNNLFNQHLLSILIYFYQNPIWNDKPVIRISHLFELEMCGRYCSGHLWLVRLRSTSLLNMQTFIWDRLYSHKFGEHQSTLLCQILNPGDSRMTCTTWNEVSWGFSLGGIQ